MTPPPIWLLEAIREIHDEICRAVVASCEQLSAKQMAEVAHDGAGDTIYAIDRVSESLLLKLFEERIASKEAIVLIAEGIEDGKVTLPRGTPEQEAAWRIIADPIDGTRCIMYQKRSGWILTGVAPNRGADTSLRDIFLAVQTEIPLLKQHLCDCLWAMEGQGAQIEQWNRVTGERKQLRPSPSGVTNIEHGFATVSRFFSGARDVLAAIDDDIHFALLGHGFKGKALCFEDQYLSTGGQLYELIMGHDRFVADLRPLLQPILKQRGWMPNLCCHPYDLCTELVAREAGVFITNEFGDRLGAPLNVEADVTWLGYANQDLQRRIQPLVELALYRQGLIKQDVL